MKEIFKGRTGVLRGRAGEDTAATYLKQHGYEIVTRNFKTASGEIDIIAASDGYLVFVEVKLRSDDEYGRPAEAVTSAKIKKICQTASTYINNFGLYDADVRFDIIEVNLLDKSINHIIDAFDSYLNF